MIQVHVFKIEFFNSGIFHFQLFIMSGYTESQYPNVFGCVQYSNVGMFVV